MTHTQNKRFRYTMPTGELAGTAPGLRVVVDNGTPIGLVNNTRNGYALRRLDGHLLDTTYGVSRDTSAARLAVLVARFARGDSRPWAEGIGR